MDVPGIFEQTRRSLDELTAAVGEGRNPSGICIAYAALLDQCATAVREAESTPGGSTERFVSLAAATSAEAFGPIVEAIANGRTPDRELRIPTEAAWWIERAFTAHARGDRATAGRCLLNAATLARPRSDPADAPPEDPPDGLSDEAGPLPTSE